VGTATLGARFCQKKISMSCGGHSGGGRRKQKNRGPLKEKKGKEMGNLALLGGKTPPTRFPKQKKKESRTV